MYVGKHAGTIVVSVTGANIYTAGITTSAAAPATQYFIWDGTIFRKRTTSNIIY